MTDDSRSVAESTESEIIALFAAAAERHLPGAGRQGAEALVVANGDDAAVFRAGSDVVASTDMIVEGTHFRRSWSSPEEIGARAIAQACSDISAMGASPRYVVLAACLPPALPIGDVARMAEGAAAEARKAGAHIIGGDVTTGPVLVLAPMALGEFDSVYHGAVSLSGARPGDTIALTGHPGRAAAGLALLEAGLGEAGNPELRDALSRFRVPSPPYELGPVAAAAGASALTDVTDGLLRDLSGLCAASGVAAGLNYASLDADPVLDEAAQRLGDPAAVRDWRLDGGEDHGLLATFPRGTELPGGFAAIGVILEPTLEVGEGTVLVDGEPVEASGWDSARGERAGGGPQRRP
ncbi:thiamine-phosphate kinase [Dietzia sp.]|uniref:thiamine-phosphate kinase n=1 Tax=Dietzia sp. TaxID=1871616 RepID=UPI002FDACC8E